MYSPIKPSRSLFADIRGLKHHIRVWGEDAAPPLFFLHGAWDASPTFQFLVDHLKDKWRILALDWRGYGGSEWAPAYWFHDLVADMDVLADQFSPGKPMNIVGHSMGSNAAHFFAGARPERVARLVSLDGFGLADDGPQDALQRYQRWLDTLKVEPGMRSYASTQEMGERLMRGNPNLPADKAAFLGAHVSRKLPDGTFTWNFDPRHRNPYPVQTRLDGWAAGFANIQASVLLLSAGQNRNRRLSPEALTTRIGLVPRHAHIHIKDVGHNLHHDAPDLVARLIEPFLKTGELPASATI
jgi:pimeloyl-ACP methyl ester carboxylesterase